MFDKTFFPFDTESLTKMFTQPDFTKYFSDSMMNGMKAEDFMSSQKKNMEALVEANKAAAAGYQDLFKKQTKIFEATMTEAQDHIKGFDASKAAADPAAQGELMKAAFEKAVANMKDLAETAQKANADAYEIVSARIKDSVAELGRTMKT